LIPTVYSLGLFPSLFQCEKRERDEKCEKSWGMSALISIGRLGSRREKAGNLQASQIWGITYLILQVFFNAKKNDGDLTEAFPYETYYIDTDTAT